MPGNPSYQLIPGTLSSGRRDFFVPRTNTPSLTNKKLKSEALDVCGWRRFLHWISAFFVLLLFLPITWFGVEEHKLIGMIVLGLFLTRMLSSWVGYSVKHSRHGRIESAIAVTVQKFVLLALFLLPVSGLLMHSLSGPGVAIAGFSEDFLKLVVPIPALVRWLTSFHAAISWLLALGIVLHVAGALKHHFYDRDATLSRMLSGTYVSKSNSLGIALESDTVIRGTGYALLITSITTLSVTLLHLQAEKSTGSTIHLASVSSKNLGSWQSVPRHSEIKIFSRHHSRGFEARLNNFHVQLDLGDDLQPRSVDLRIDSNSFKSDLRRRDELVTESDWLNSTIFPDIRYASRKFWRVNDEKWIATGMLMFKQHAFSLPVAFELKMPNQNEIIAKGRVLLDRFEIGLGTGVWSTVAVADRGVVIEFEVRFRKSETRRTHNGQPSKFGT